jgi:serine/threonine-protein kinase
MAGMILGTAAYMAPEQAKGRPADKRSDIWAFACVLYEMLTGKRAFEGEDVSDTLAAVLRGDPDWAALPSTAPRAITHVLRRCLQRDPKQRLHDIADVRILNEEISNLPARARQGPARPAMLIAAAVILLLAGAAAASLFQATRAVVVPRVEQLEIPTPRDAAFSVNPTGRNVVISADGSQIAYNVLTAATSILAVRRFDRLDQVLIPGTELGLFPEFSPDGAQLAFATRRKLQKVSASGGPVIPICDLTADFAGASWYTADTIVFAERGNGLFRVPATGGKPEKIAAPDRTKGELEYFSPEVLPGGKAVLFTIVPIEGTVSQARIAVRTLTDGTTRILVEGAAAARYVATGHLVYLQAGTLTAAPFDLETLSISGPATAVRVGISFGSTFDGNAADFAVGSDGSLIYAPVGSNNARGLIWVDRQGKRLGALSDQPLDYPRYPRLDAAGRRVAMTIGPGNEGQVWIHDLKGGSQPLKLTSKGHNTQPIWTPDGTHITLASTALGVRNLFQLPSDASSLQLDRLTTSANVQIPLSASPDGRELLFRETGVRTQSDIWRLPLTGDREPKPWLDSEFSEDEAAFSPNGRWVAYVSDQTGPFEVWIRPFPGPGPPTRVSSRGGHDPVWSRNGKELFYQEGAKLMSLDVGEQASEIRVTSPRELFEGGFVLYTQATPRTYDVAADGRFLMIEPNESSRAASLILVKNWFEELKRLVPTR